MNFGGTRLSFEDDEEEEEEEEEADRRLLRPADCIGSLRPRSVIALRMALIVFPWSIARRCPRVVECWRDVALALFEAFLPTRPNFSRRDGSSTPASLDESGSSMVWSEVSTVAVSEEASLSSASASVFRADSSFEVSPLYSSQVGSVPSSAALAVNPPLQVRVVSPELRAYPGSHEYSTLSPTATVVADMIIAELTRTSIPSTTGTLQDAEKHSDCPAPLE